MTNKKRLIKIKKLRKRRKLLKDYIEFTKGRIDEINHKLFNFIIGKD